MMADELYFQLEFEEEGNTEIDLEFDETCAYRTNLVYHRELRDRDEANSHSIEAITGLSERLGSIISDKSYIHSQRVASDKWDIIHNLDKYPSITVVDSANTVVVGEITYIDRNSVTINFRGAFSGKAYLN